MESPESYDRPSSDRRALRRTQNACRRCKRRKIKCSGEQPCRNCEAGTHECLFDEGGRRITVLQSEYRKLQERLTAFESTDERVLVNSGERGRRNSSRLNVRSSLGELGSAPQAHERHASPRVLLPTSGLRASSLDHTGQSPLQVDATTRNDITNPLTTSPSSFAIDPLGSQRYMGHSSTWSFSRKVRALVKSHVRDFQLHDETAGLEGAAYEMSTVLEKTTGQGVPDELPSLEYMEFLLNSVQFHLGSVLHLFDKASFLEILRQRTFGGPAGSIMGNAIVENLWTVKAQLVVAFGKLLTGRQATKFGPPGAESFIQAVQSLPSISILCRQPILAVEVLCLVALYLQCADMRNAAYVYIGQATSIALSRGLNCFTNPELMAQRDYDHCLKLWCTVYILGIRLSTLMGTPPLLNDKEDISAPLPDCGDSPTLGSCNVILTLHINLSRVLGKVVRGVYQLNADSRRPFLDGVQDVLSLLSSLTEELNKKAPLRSNGPGGFVSRNAATLYLTYYQCAILAIRPLIFYLVQKRFEMAEKGQPPKEISEPIRSLVQTCVDSATSSLEILSALHEESLIELFLPFDSESTFSSAFVIVLATIVGTDFLPALKYFEVANSILHNMSQRGNIQVINYEIELGELFDMAAIIRRGHNNNQSRDANFQVDVDITDMPPASFEIGDDSMQSALHFLDDEYLNMAQLGNINDDWFWETGNVPIPATDYP